MRPRDGCPPPTPPAHRSGVTSGAATRPSLYLLVLPAAAGPASRQAEQANNNINNNKDGNFLSFGFA